MKATNRGGKIIITAVVVIVVIVSISCAIMFWPREKELTAKEWLDAFSNSFEYATMTKSIDGNILDINMVREIEVLESGAVVIRYKQTLQITMAEDGQALAYLAVEESYPTLEESKDDLVDEYYLCQGIMYTRREKGGNVQSSQFDSDLNILLTVASENLGNAKYNFDEKNFLPVENGKGIITHDGNVHRINAMISQDSYKKFFGESANIDGMSDVEIYMQMTDERFDWLQIQYVDGDLKTTIKINNYDIQPITAPDWAQ